MKRYISITLSALLLISFAMILIPLDIFHNHKSVPSQSQVNKKHSSKHNLNTQVKKDYCWVCTVQFDKSFTKTSFIEKLQVSHAFSVFAENDYLSYFVEQLFSTLRGPPSR